MIDKFNKTKKVTWETISKSENPPSADNISCPLCLLDFLDTDQVIRLKCHHNHVYHRHCFEEYLNHGRKAADAVDNRQKSDKCPVCRQDIEFE